MYIQIDTLTNTLSWKLKDSCLPHLVRSAR